MAALDKVPVAATNLLRSFESLSSRRIALLRIRCLEGNKNERNNGLAADVFMPLFVQAVTPFLRLHITQHAAGDPPDATEAGAVTAHFHRVLLLYRSLVQMDPVLSEELGRQGAHKQLCRVMEIESDEVWMDICFEIAAASRNFPATTLPFDKTDLKSRLPLTFELLPSTNYSTDETPILVNQVTERQSEQKDVGFVLWPSAVILSHILFADPSVVHGKTVLELGAGCGLVGLVAAKIQQRQHPPNENAAAASSASITLTDFNTLVLENLKQNIALNDVTASVVGLDFYQQTGESDHWIDMQNSPRQQVDVVLAADIICQPSDARAAANTLYDTLLPDAVAYVVCADAAHRFGVDCFVMECERVGLNINCADAKDLHNETFPTTDLHQTTGYVDNMSLTIFTIHKNQML